jgi:hypothetical protein
MEGFAGGGSALGALARAGVAWGSKRGRKDDEVDLSVEDYDEAARAQATPVHAAANRYVASEALREAPTFSTEAGLPEGAKELVLKTWVRSLCPAIVEEGHALGLVAISPGWEARTESALPQVRRHGLGSEYTITRRRGSGGGRYNFYEIRPDRGAWEPPRRSRKTRVYVAGPEPDARGRLRSVVASLLDAQRRYERAERVDEVATQNMAKPIILLEKPPGAQGGGASEASRFILGGQDDVEDGAQMTVARVRADSEATNATELAAVRRHNAGLAAMQERGAELASQGLWNMFDAPPGTRSASYNPAKARGDMGELWTRYATSVAWAYGLQLAHLETQGGRFQVAQGLASASLDHAVDGWREKLGEILTDLVARTWPGWTGEIAFPRRVRDDAAGLLEKWGVGLLTWEGTRALVAAATGIDEKYMEAREPPRPLPETAPGSSPSSGKRGRDEKKESGKETKKKKKKKADRGAAATRDTS